MRIAIPYENGNIFQHFGRSEAFKFYDVDGGAVTATAVVSTNGSGHGALAGFLVAHHADAVICGGIGGGAQSALTEAGIRFYGGVSGSADAAVQALLDGSLGYDPEARCDHHDHAHGAGHTAASTAAVNTAATVDGNGIEQGLRFSGALARFRRHKENFQFSLSAS